MPLKFQWVRPKRYAERPETLGQHLLKRRREKGLFQRDIAKRLGVKVWTYLLWEQDRAQPTVRYYPPIFSFLGYDPFPAPANLAERLASKRRVLGLSIKQAAKLLGVDEGTFSRWESGQWKPRMSGSTVERFMALPAHHRLFPDEEG
ncbi:MAG TPA: helix-turn-helix domain-containing protein [Rhizomicrobium sp.]|nr:helix-turn-helix domain-containing protein [Rhizomicrobium sp.]